jgi:hypothetical protein
MEVVASETSSSSFLFSLFSFFGVVVLIGNLEVG